MDASVLNRKGHGAGEVIAYSLENPNVSGFNKLKQLLNSKVSYIQGSVYSLSPEDAWIV